MNDTVRRHPRTLSDAFADVRAPAIEGKPVHWIVEEPARVSFRGWTWIAYFVVFAVTVLVSVWIGR